MKEKDNGVFFFSSKREEKKHKEKKTIERKKMQRREGAYLSSLAFAFGMKCSSCLLLSTFFQPTSPPSSSLVFHISLKLCATQALEIE
jgi:hypothetical protein